MAPKGMGKHNPTVSKKHLSVCMRAATYLFFFPWNERAVLGVADLFTLPLPFLGCMRAALLFSFEQSCSGVVALPLPCYLEFLVHHSYQN